jgi:hypothetical protein
MQSGAISLAHSGVSTWIAGRHAVLATHALPKLLLRQIEITEIATVEFLINADCGRQDLNSINHCKIEVSGAFEDRTGTRYYLAVMDRSFRVINDAVAGFGVGKQGASSVALHPDGDKNQFLRQFSSKLTIVTVRYQFLRAANIAFNSPDVNIFVDLSTQIREKIIRKTQRPIRPALTAAIG